DYYCQVYDRNTWIF
nr:immunoglobulin light chain junction region [Macaca mulatta]